MLFWHFSYEAATTSSFPCLYMRFEEDDDRSRHVLLSSWTVLLPARHWWTLESTNGEVRNVCNL